MAGIDGGARPQGLIGRRLGLVALASVSMVLLGVRLLDAAGVRDVSMPKADEVLVDKSDRKLFLLSNGQVIATFAIALGFNPAGHKTQQGDGRTPEGRYLLDWRNPNSRFHLSIHISYPNAADKAQAKGRGVSPGGDIFIHGTPWAPAAWFDWTAGCIAVSNDAMDVIWATVSDGTLIEIRP